MAEDDSLAPEPELLVDMESPLVVGVHLQVHLDKPRSSGVLHHLPGKLCAQAQVLEVVVDQDAELCPVIGCRAASGGEDGSADDPLASGVSNDLVTTHMVFKTEKYFDRSFTLRDGTTVSIRSLKKTDYTKLWDMCSTLSDETLSQLPPLNEELVRRWCEYAEDVRSIQAVATR